MPSSKHLKRVEIPLYLHEQLVQIARREERTVTSVLHELVYYGLQNYRSSWVPSQHLDKFTPAALQALAYAKEEAQMLNHHYIGTEHLLLGLLRGTDDPAARVLKSLDVKLEVVRLAVETLIGRGAAPSPTEIEYVPRVRKVLGFAAEAAQKPGHKMIGTEHLLGGLVREGEGIAAGILKSLGVLDKIPG
jgi:hypothetical protein